jgi:hypothetical protein
MTEPWFTIWTYLYGMLGFVGGMALVGALALGILVLTSDAFWSRVSRVLNRLTGHR